MVKKKITLKQRKEISKRMKKLWENPELRKKMSKAAKKRHKEKPFGFQKGHPEYRTEESFKKLRKKLSKSAKDRKFSLETRLKMSESGKKAAKKYPNRGFQKGHKTFVSPETYKKIAEKIKGERVERIKKICKKCGKEFLVVPSMKEQKYCSSKCFTIARNYKTGPDSHTWKAEKAKYCAKHRWIHKIKGKASEHKCIDCGKQAQQWSNVDHKYSRNPDDYQPRCMKCHRVYDIANNGSEYGRNAKA